MLKYLPRSAAASGLRRNGDLPSRRRQNRTACPPIRDGFPASSSEPPRRPVCCPAMGKRSFIGDLDDRLRGLYTELMEDSRALLAELDKDLTFDRDRLVLQHTANRGRSPERSFSRPPPR